MLYGTQQLSGLPISYFFTYDGTSVPWALDRLDSVSPLTNSAEPVDGSYEISDLSITFDDVDGQIWGALGYGTSCLNKEVTFAAKVGGLFALDEPYAYGSGQPFNLHTGRITRVTRKSRQVTIASRCKMALLGSMLWNYPIFGEDSNEFNSVGTFYFCDGAFFSVSGAHPDQDPALCKFNMNDSGDEFDAYLAVATTTQSLLSSRYPIAIGRGTVTCPPPQGYHFLGSQFHWDYPMVKLRGTFLGTLFGTIQTDDEAAQFGFNSLAAADAAKVGGSMYQITKTRLSYQGGTLAGSHFMPRIGRLSFSGRPSEIYSELLTGAMVWPYFGTSDIDGTSLAEFSLVTTYNSFSASIGPDEILAMDALKNFFNSTFSLFSVTPDNTFQIVAYGPKNLLATIPSLGSHDIIESETYNDIEDYYNRVQISYGYFEGTYKKSFGTSLSGWTPSIDRPFLVESKWMNDENEAAVFTTRLLRRYQNSIPRYKLTLPLNHLGIDIGSLYTIQDVDIRPGLIGSKTIQITQYEKDISDSRDVHITGWDADSLYQRRGFAFWDSGTALPAGTGGTLNTAIWGSTLHGLNWYTSGAEGTAPGINNNIFGTCFSFW